jgi:rod shape-determining protein MreC
MQNLIQFLFRNGVVILFLALEALCLYLVVQTNQRQRQIYLRTSDYVTGGLHQQMSALLDFINLREVNDSLMLENARLRKRLYEQNMTATSADTLRAADTTLRYEIIPALVIKNSLNSRNNYLTLNRGSRNDIAPGRGVITDDGPVGIVVSVTPRFSKVMSILHANTMLSASIEEKGYFGTLEWKGLNPTKMQLAAIPKHAFLESGDVVTTSGYSHIFPAGIVIGEVDTFTLDGGSNFYTVDVDLNIDMGNVQSVYVIRNTFAGEQQSLDSETR